MATSDVRDLSFTPADRVDCDLAEALARRHFGIDGRAEEAKRAEIFEEAKVQELDGSESDGGS